jgi:hypothetical protein
VTGQPLAPVGCVEIHACEVRQLHVALLVPYREIIAIAAVEITEAGEAHPVAVDECPRHQGDFWPPSTIVRGRNGNPPRNHPEAKDHQGCTHALPTGQPENPECETRKGQSQDQTQPWPRKVRLKDGEAHLSDEQDFDQNSQSRTEAAKQPKQKPAS